MWRRVYPWLIVAGGVALAVWMFYRYPPPRISPVLPPAPQQQGKDAELRSLEEELARLRLIERKRELRQEIDRLKRRLKVKEVKP